MEWILGFATAAMSWHTSLLQKREYKKLIAFAQSILVFAFITAGQWYTVLVALFILWIIGSEWFAQIRKNNKPSIPSGSVTSHLVSTADTPEVESKRRSSIEAMKRSTKAREQDIKKRAEQPAQNIYTSRYLADIEFDYRDAGGHDSHRHVGVEAVDDEYFEGHCHTAQDTRTFVIGRVHGKVLDCDTGELQPPKKWAAGVRSDPRNSGVVVSRGWKSPDLEDGDQEQPIEILFTGFSKEQRAELEEQAEIFEMVVRKNITKGLKYLCAGPNAGPAKLSQAIEAGVQIIDESEFVQLLVRS